MLTFDAVERSFGSRRVLDGLTFDVQPGCLTGFVGANGAGKTTTLRIGAGILAPEAGSVLWSGRPITRTVQRSFGYMPEERGLYPKMAIHDQLVHFGELHGLTRSESAAQSKSWLERLDLWERHEERLDSLSLGNQQRVQIIAAVLHRPICLLLDEPFSGLDPFAVDSLTEVLRETARGGVPVLFSSHQLDLVERICDELVVISNGRVADTSPGAEHSSTEPVYRLELDRNLTWTRELPEIEVLSSPGTTLRFRSLVPGAEQALLARAAREAAVLAFTVEKRDLHTVFKENAR